MRIATLVLVLCIAGCEEMARKGRPGDPGYIAPDYRMVKIVAVHPFESKAVGGQTYIRKSHTVVEDDRKRRYIVPGEVGTVGESFEMDVSLKEPVE